MRVLSPKTPVAPEAKPKVPSKVKKSRKYGWAALLPKDITGSAE